MEHNKSVIADDSLLADDHSYQYVTQTQSAANSMSEDGQRDAEHCDRQELTIGPKTKLYLAVLALITYLLAWIVWIVFREALWTSSVNISKVLSHIPGYLNFHSWIFSELFYKWYPFIIVIILCFAPRKDRAWSSITIFMVSYICRQYIRLLVHESRPVFYSVEIKPTACGCSYGMPSGHSEGATLMYTLLAYNFMSSAPSKLERYLVSSVVVIICLCIYFARVYYGQHTYMQVTLGACQGWLFFSWFLLTEKKMNGFFRKVLNFKTSECLLLWRLSGTVAAVTLVVWFFWFDSALSNHSIYHETCQSCFKNYNQNLRVDLGRAFMFCFYYFGLVIGTVIIEPQYKLKHAVVLVYMRKLTSVHALKKVIIVLIIHAPLLIAMIKFKSPDWTVLICLSVYLCVGVLLGYLPSIFQRLKCDFDGDVASWTTPDGLKY